MPAMQGVRDRVAAVKIKDVDSKYLCLFFALSLRNSFQEVLSFIINYYLKGCIEAQKLKITLSGRTLRTNSPLKGIRAAVIEGDCCLDHVD